MNQLVINEKTRIAKEKQKIAHKQWRDKNRAGLNEKQKVWRTKNPQYFKEFHTKNPQYIKEWEAKHPNYKNEKTKIWYRANKTKSDEDE